MPTALVIGASRGIGREFSRQLARDGWKVWATARDGDSFAALHELGCTVIKLDVASADSIATLAQQLDGRRFDLALYVAGVYGPDSGAESAPTSSDFDKVMRTNVWGAMRLIPTVAPLVEAARGKFIFLSSSMGSIAATPGSSHWIYRSSKAALNMAVKAASFDYPHAAMVAMCPGWVKTDMGGPQAPLTVEESVAGMRTVIASLQAKDSGCFYNYEGKQLSW